MDITRYMPDLSMKPVPKQSPIPPNSVACLRGRYFPSNLEAGTFFTLCKNKKELVITGPPLKKTPEMDNMGFCDLTDILDKAFIEYFAILEDLIPTIEFGVTSHAHLVPDPYTEGFQVVLDYAKQLRHVSCPIWAPIIPLKEIEFTVWGTNSDRRGIWKGKEVDIFYAYDDRQMWRLNRSMYALRQVDGLDFTFELYGHLTDSDGTIVGIVSEAAWGRPIKPSDKEFIVAELKRLESHGCVYNGIWCNHLLIANGRLRLLQYIAIHYYTDPVELRKDAAFLHTECLDTLCQEIEDFGPIGHYRFLPSVLTDDTGIIQYLRHSIPRGLSTTTMVFVLKNIERPGFRAIVNYSNKDDSEESDHPRRITCLRTRRPQRESLRLIYANLNRNNGPLQSEDTPLSSHVKLRHRVFLPIRHPPEHSTSARILRAIPGRNLSEVISDTVDMMRSV